MMVLIVPVVLIRTFMTDYLLRVLHGENIYIHHFNLNVKR